MRDLLLSSLAALLLVPAVFPQSGKKNATPSPEQILYQEMEITMFVALDPCTWQGREYDDHSTPLARINPARLDVNQWIDAAEMLGARMILFVAKHVGGFCWWRTETSDYSIKHTPFRNGQGDVLRELSDACRRRGMRLGVYIYPGDDTWGASLGGGGRTRDPSRQEAYNSVLRKQWEEVLTRYGQITELWFDGSCVVPLDDVVRRHAPDAVIMQSPMASIRWVGNERGFAPYPAWNGVKREDARTGVATAAHGDPDGDVWMPLEVDIPLKNHHWFWSPTNEKTLKTLDELTEIYYTSVGRGALLLVNSAPDTTGLIPAADMKLYGEFGELIRKRFGRSIAQTAGKGDLVELSLGQPARVDHVITMEDIAFGERVREYVLEGSSGGQWSEIVRGISVGHKRIDRFPAVTVEKIRFRSLKSSAPPVIRSLAAYMVGDANTYDRIAPAADDYGNPWTSGERTTYGVPVALGELKEGSLPREGWYAIDLSRFIGEAGQYHIFAGPTPDGPALPVDSGSVSLQGIETPGVCTVNSVFRRVELSLSAVPTMEEGSIRVAVKVPSAVGEAKVYLRKVEIE